MAKLEVPAADPVFLVCKKDDKDGCRNRRYKAQFQPAESDTRQSKAAFRAQGENCFGCGQPKQFSTLEPVTVVGRPKRGAR